MTPTPRDDIPTPENPPSEAGAHAPPRDDHIALGRRGEDLALTWLRARGYSLMARNFRFGRHGELDLIMQAPDGDLAFIEVKTGRGDAAGDPLGWINGRKRHKIQRIAQAWCLQSGIAMNRPMRFDAVAVRPGPRGDMEIVHVPHAFLPEGDGYWRG